jgi:hypothetical protein
MTTRDAAVAMAVGVRVRVGVAGGVLVGTAVWTGRVAVAGGNVAGDREAFRSETVRTVWLVRDFGQRAGDLFFPLVAPSWRPFRCGGRRGNGWRRYLPIRS